MKIAKMDSKICWGMAQMLKREHCDEYFLARVNFAKRKSQQGEKKSSHKTKLESIKKRRIEDPREGEIVRGGGEEEVGRRGGEERGMRQVGEPEFERGKEDAASRRARVCPGGNEVRETGRPERGGMPRDEEGIPRRLGATVAARGRIDLIPRHEKCPPV
ncbi:hypothetical protein EAG_05816 [Camponotus floridanus]|uniref:Uncharacterized protein n=1 Tax=Camponotus floridanus TaxID=104421 RepID=E2AZN2_CAMFO|nr:hypothetical protein EAG_05816 [Camponotus floridanus]